MNYSAITKKKGAGLLILILCIALYGNTLTHDYALDDAIVITDNEFTTQGFSGISDIFSKDTFAGFFKEEGKSNLVSGGRYRPMSLAFFAAGWQIFGDNPMLFHLFNILYFALLGWLIFLMLSSFGKTKQLLKGYFPILVTILFLSHPIHTEVVANIKGRDEIFSFLGSVLATYLLTKKTLNNNLKMGLVFTSFLFALLSKENAITFLAIAPLSFYLLNDEDLKTSIMKTWPLWLATIIFLIIRTEVIGFSFGDSPRELMNNPFLKIKNGQYVDFSLTEKLGAIFYTLGTYIKLLLFPHPLTHDYYPKHIDVKGFANFGSIASLIGYLAMGIFALLKIKSKPIISYSILFFILSLSIVSNIVFPVGTNMAERFVFMPSLGFVIIIALGLAGLFHKNKTIALALLSILLIGYSAKTIHRNLVWKNDYTLFTTDVKTSDRSAKCLNAAGGVIQNKASKMSDGGNKEKLLNQGIAYLNKAIEIHPTYKNAYLLLGNSYFYKKAFPQAIEAYEQSLKLSPGYTDAENNLAVSYREYGKRLGEKQNNLTAALTYLEKSYKLRPQDVETNRLLGVANGMSGFHDKAIPYFEKITQLNPNSALNFSALYKAYTNAGLPEKAQEAYNKALSLDPNVFKK